MKHTHLHSYQNGEIEIVCMVNMRLIMTRASASRICLVVENKRVNAELMLVFELQQVTLFRIYVE